MVTMSSMSMSSTSASLTSASPPGERILVAPVPVSPTKPLTPTHLKYLLSLDVLCRAAATFADLTLVYHHAAYAGSQQVAGFWAYLDQARPGLACDELSEEDIGELYMAHHRGRPPSSDAAEAMARRAETGWVHPVTARLLDLWEEDYRLLGLMDPQLGRTGPPLAAEAPVLDLLRSYDLCIDGRPLGAPVYLDATAAGLPLRLIRSADGRANYLLYLLRELVPLLNRHDLVVLAHDTELRSDYRTVVHVLNALATRTTRFEVSRVPVNGSIQSARFGGWEGCTLAAFAGPLIDEFGLAAFQLGLRLYLVTGLGRVARESFSLRYLKRWVRRARMLLASYPAADAADLRDTRQYLHWLSRNRGYPDPYQVVTSLVGRGTAAPVGGLLQVVMPRSG